MGNVGGAFGQSFVNTYIQGQQVMAQVEDRRKQLELQKKLADVTYKKHELEIEDLTRRLQAQTGLKERLMEIPGSEDMSSIPAAPLSEGERMNFGAMLNPSEAGRQLLAPPEPPAQSMEEQAGAINKALGGMGGQAPTARPAEAPQQSQGEDLGPTVFNAPTVKTGKKGLELSVTQQKQALQTETREIPDPSSPHQTLIVERTFNPLTGQRGNWIPTLAVPTKAIQSGMATVQTWGYDPLSPGGQDLSRRVAVIQSSNAPPEAIAKALTNLRQEAGAGAISADPLEKARTQIKAEEVNQAGKVTKAKKEAEQSVPERLSPSERKEMEANVSAIDLYGQIKATYNPKFVGPVRMTLGQVSGGPSAAFRQATGIMTQEEQRFRSNIALSNNALIKEASGANVPPQEFARLSKQLPDPDALPPKQFEARLATATLYAKAVGIRKRQILEGSGADVSGLPRVTLTTEERRTLAEPILAEFDAGKITKEEAVTQLMGLSGFGETGAYAFLGVQGPRRGGR